MRPLDLSGVEGYRHPIPRRLSWIRRQGHLGIIRNIKYPNNWPSLIWRLPPIGDVQPPVVRACCRRAFCRNPRPCRRVLRPAAASPGRVLGYCWPVTITCRAVQSAVISVPRRGHRPSSPAPAGAFLPSSTKTYGPAVVAQHRSAGTVMALVRWPSHDGDRGVHPGLSRRSSWGRPISVSHGAGRGVDGLAPPADVPRTSCPAGRRPHHRLLADGPPAARPFP